MKWNAARLNPVWVGTLFATAGAVLGNVLTIVQWDATSLVPFAFVAASLCCYTYLAQVMALADRHYAIGCNMLTAQESKSDLHEEVYGKVRFKANACFVLGALLLSLATVAVARANQSSAAANRAEDMRASAEIVDAIRGARAEVERLRASLQSAALNRCMFVEAGALRGKGLAGHSKEKAQHATGTQ